MKSSNKLSVFLIVIFILGLSLFLIYKEGALPVDKNDTASKIFTVQMGESLNLIARDLEKEGFIRNKLVFYIVVKKLSLEKKIQAGDFRLSPSMNAYEIAQNLTHGTLDAWVTIIEGLRKEEVAHIFSRELNIPEVEFIKYAKEGYLFPDTYSIPRQATVPAIINILENNFEKKYNQELKDKASKIRLTDNEVIILASLVEKEARSDDDRKQIASIILKRYKNEWPLQVDATLQYALGFQPIEKTWWKKALTNDDKEIDSPYNTYKNTGLPPMAIANPGLAAIKAVLDANENTAYWYYLSDKNGKIYYAKTIEEHEENIRKYLQ